MNFYVFPYLLMEKSHARLEVRSMLTAIKIGRLYLALLAGYALATGAMFLFQGNDQVRDVFVGLAATLLVISFGVISMARPLFRSTYVVTILKLGIPIVLNFLVGFVFHIFIAIILGICALIVAIYYTTNKFV